MARFTIGRYTSSALFVHRPLLSVLSNKSSIRPQRGKSIFAPGIAITHTTSQGLERPPRLPVRGRRHRERYRLTVRLFMF